VPVGGGGLLAGLSFCLKQLKASVKVYGVVWEGTPDFCRKFNQVKKLCLCQKEALLLESKSGLTDGVAVKKSHPEMLELCSQYVDGVFCVSEKEISEAIIKIKNKTGKGVEGSGVLTLAALLKYHKTWDLGKNCCAMISGGNIDQDTLSKILSA